MRLIGSAHRRAELMIGAVAATSIAALAAVVAIPGPAAVPTPDFARFDAGLRWSKTAITPNGLEAIAAGNLLAWLLVVAGAAAAVGGISILALWAQQASLRASEIAVHRAVGASRRRLFGDAISEGFGILAAAALIGLGAATLIRGMIHLVDPAVARSTWIAISAIGAPLLLGALFPLWVVRSRRVAEPGTTEPPLSIASAQLGASLVVLVAGAVLVRHAEQSLSTMGAQLPDTAMISTVAVSDVSLADRSERLRRIAGTARGDAGGLVSITNAGGHLGLGTVDELTTECGQCVVGGVVLKWRQVRTTYQAASADTFEARRNPIVEGRGFTDDDRVGAERVAVVNVYLARRYFESGKPLGRMVYPNGWLNKDGYRVVGVVDDERPSGFGGGEAPLETLYLSALQHPPAVAEIATTAAGAQPPPAALARETMATLHDRSNAVIRWFGRWFFGEAVLLLALALAGTAALMLLWVNAFKQELAIRRAVGARRSQILRLVLVRSAVTGIRGVGVGLVFFAPTIFPELGRMIPGLSPWQADLIVSFGVLLVGTAVLAAIVPAIRAARTAPAALWSER